jgi:hypothetical protein
MSAKIAKIASVSRMKKRSRMVISLDFRNWARGKLVSFYIEISGERHGQSGGCENADPNDVLATGPTELAVRVNDEAVEHQPPAQRDEQARQRAAPPADQADSYRHDSELRSPMNVLAGGGDRHRDAEGHAERHDADECVGEAWVCEAHRPAVDHEGAGTAVRQRQHGFLLSNRCPSRATIK